MAKVTKVIPTPPPVTFVAELSEGEKEIIHQALRSFKYIDRGTKPLKEFDAIEAIEVQFAKNG